MALQQEFLAPRPQEPKPKDLELSSMTLVSVTERRATMDLVLTCLSALGALGVGCFCYWCFF